MIRQPGAQPQEEKYAFIIQNATKKVSVPERPKHTFATMPPNPPIIIMSFGPYLSPKKPLINCPPAYVKVKMVINQPKVPLVKPNSFCISPVAE
jgi:hypothetical protein